MAINEEYKQSLATPALFSNRFVVARMGDGIARLAFGEAVDGEVHFHSAIRIPEIDLAALRDLLNEQLPAAEKQN